MFFDNRRTVTISSTLKPKFLNPTLRAHTIGMPSKNRTTDRACLWKQPIVSFLLLFFVCPVNAVTVDAQVVDEDKSIVETIATTLDHLREEISQEYFELRYLSREELIGRKDNPAFFFITDAATFASLIDYGAWAVGAMKNPLAIDSSHTSGAAFVARKERSDITSLMDIKDKTIIGMSQAASLSTLIGLKELQRLFGSSFSPNDVKYTGGPVEKVIHQIIAGKGDVGIVDACLLERMEKDGNIPQGALKVISAKDSKDLKCKHSTELYPGWVLAASKPSNLLTAKERDLILQVTSALQTVPKLPGLMEWTEPADNSVVMTLLNDVEEQNKGKEHWENFLRKYFPWFIGFLGFLVLILAHSFYVSWLVRKRTSQLTASMKKAHDLQQEVNSEQEKISSMERAGIAAQLSSLIAHELQQPLNAITNFSRGLRIREERGNLREDVLRETLIKITEQSETAAKIVGKVRNYAKQRQSEHKILGVLSQLKASIQKFQQIKGKEIPIVLSGKEEYLVEADAMELDLFFYNLLKNAWEACKDQNEPQININVSASGRNVFIRFTDNGPRVNQGLVESMFVPGISTKSDGLGLGLSICRGLAEAHGGNLKAFLDEENCLVMELELPKISEIKERGE